MIAVATFNSLYEILQQVRQLLYCVVLPFNSLYEIPSSLSNKVSWTIDLSILFMRFKDIDNAVEGYIIDLNFQFSLWDSSRKYGDRGRLWRHNFQFSLWDSAVSALASAEGNLDFQFSLWDSWHRRLELRRRVVRLSILFMRFRGFFSPCFSF